MNILLLGATGATGKELLRQALDAGHTLTVLVRTPAKITEDKTNLRIFTGDATDEKAVESAMVGNDVVISTLGSMNTSVIRESSKAITAAARRTHIKRVIMLSSFVVRRERLKNTARLLTGIIMKSIIADKNDGENILRTSGLNWTIVYATPLLNKSATNPTRVLSPSEKIGLSYQIARSEVAAWILDELDDKSHLNKDVVISR